MQTETLCDASTFTTGSLDRVPTGTSVDVSEIDVISIFRVRLSTREYKIYPDNSQKAPRGRVHTRVIEERGAGQQLASVLCSWVI
jgi:hypothetical protein